MKRNSAPRKALIFALGAGLILILLLPLMASRIIRERLIAAVKSECQGCAVQIQSTRLSFLPTSLSLTRVRFVSGDPKTTEVQAEAERISAVFSARRLLRGEISISDLKIHAPQVTVTEGDRPSPSSKRESDSKLRWKIEKTKILDGRFRYVRVQGERKAQLRVSKIQGQVGAVGNLGSLRDALTRAEASGRLERSGEFLVTVAMPVFAKDLRVNVDLKISDQNLADISPFFETSEGVKLEGKLISGHGSARLREDRLHAQVSARYQDLSVQMQKIEDRGALSAFLSNLAASVKLASANLDKPPAKQTERVELQEKERESSLQLILRGLRDGALKVASH